MKIQKILKITTSVVVSLQICVTNLTMLICLLNSVPLFVHAVSITVVVLLQIGAMNLTMLICLLNSVPLFVHAVSIIVAWLMLFL